MKTPEGYEKDDLDKFFKGLIATGEIWLFKPYMAGFGKSGVSDYVGCHLYHGGQLFSIEVKREGKEPTPIQNRRMAEIEAAGGKTFWGTAAKVIPEFEEWIKNESVPYGKIISMLKNARNILKDGRYLYADEIDKALG